MEEIKKKNSSQSRYPESIYIREKANFRRKVYINFMSAEILWWHVMAVITAWFHGYLACVNMQHRVIA